MAQSVAIIRPGALGDTILGLPLIASVRSKHPGARVSFLGRRAYRFLVPDDVDFSGFDDPANLWLFHESEIGRSPGGSSWDYAYVVLNREEVVVRNLRRAGTPHVRHVQSIPPGSRHVVDHLHDGLGLPRPVRAPALLHRAPHSRLDLIWVHPGSGGPWKCAPLDLLGWMVKRASAYTGWPVVATLGEDDGFIKEAPEWTRFVSDTGAEVMESRPLHEICRHLGRGRLFVGNDCGISHLAAGLGVASIVLFTRTDPHVWAPWAGQGDVWVVDLRCGVGGEGDWSDEIEGDLGAFLEVARWRRV